MHSTLFALNFVVELNCVVCKYSLKEWMALWLLAMRIIVAVIKSTLNATKRFRFERLNIFILSLTCRLYVPIHLLLRTVERKITVWIKFKKEKNKRKWNKRQSFLFCNIFADVSCQYQNMVQSTELTHNDLSEFSQLFSYSREGYDEICCFCFNFYINCDFEMKNESFD